MIYIFFLVLQLLMAGFMLYLLLAFVTGAPFVPSQTNTARRMVELAQLKKGMTIYDLGSGDGRILFLAAAQGARAIGIEINPYLVWYARVRAALSPWRTHISLKWESLWKTRLHDADVVFVYLLPWRMQELAAKLERELKSGSLVVSNSFIFPKWKQIRCDDQKHVYVYEVR